RTSDQIVVSIGPDHRHQHAQQHEQTDEARLGRRLCRWRIVRCSGDIDFVRSHRKKTVRREETQKMKVADACNATADAQARSAKCTVRSRRIPSTSRRKEVTPFAFDCPKAPTGWTREA